MLIITGATGQLGRQIGKLLLTKVPPTEIGLSVHDETKVSQKLRESGVRICLGNYNNPESLAFSFDNATRVLIISNLAAAATAALIADDFDDFNVSLTGLKVLNLDDIAKIVTELTGRNIKQVVILEEEYIEKLTNLGLPKFRIDISMGLFRAARRGEFASVDPTLKKILGRNPVNVRKHLASIIQSFE
ncbi:hypothetical protein HK100_007934 [Physocladia obscura]|uniref:NAD(P)-binding domain-containing protein n=1 Tax=Physocladia obscura TaxID=109957 RepID=A0AAD5SPM7_9FUNG|nr:hypothetical protein HK100_007934 [Physocladia obscura]